MDTRRRRSRAEVAQEVITERLESIERRLANAEAYVEDGANRRSSSWLHTEDWNGVSGHPKWMKHHMIPRTGKARARLEKTLERIASREKDRSGRKRRAT
jgi:hypothetical protein